MPAIIDPERISLMGFFFAIRPRTGHLHQLRVEAVGSTFRVWCELCSLVPFVLDPKDLEEPEAEEIVAILREGRFPEAYVTNHIQPMFLNRYYHPLTLRLEAERARGETLEDDQLRPWPSRYDRMGSHNDP